MTKLNLTFFILILTITSFGVRNVFAAETNLLDQKVPEVSSYLNQAKSLIQLNTGGASTSVLDLKELVNTANLSKSDIPKVLKAVGLFALNIFLVVVQTIADVLKAILFFLK